MPRQTFAPGFRISVLDLVVLVAGIAATIALSMTVWWWGFVVAFVLVHFFLFCNVIRMSRPLELTWAGVFVALASCTVALDVPGWPATGVASLALTVAFVVIEMRKPSYHGVGWQRINPSLPAWWEAHVGGMQ